MTSAAELEADANSRHKAALIAEYLWRTNLAVADVAWLPYSDRHGPSRTRLARAAYRAIPDPCPKHGDHSPPSSLGSDSWRYVLAELADLYDRERFGFPEPAPPRDFAYERDQWRQPGPVETLELPEPGELPDEEPDEIPAEIPPGVIVCGPAEPTPEDVAMVREFAALIVADPRVPPDLTADAVQRATLEALHAPAVPRRARPLDLVAYATPPALVTAGSPPLLPGEAIPTGPPRGWAVLAAPGPLNPARPCRWCGAPAVVGTLNGWRCADHPPRRGDPRGDWGWGFNWAPNPAKPPCLAAACYCGRCPHYDPAGQALKQGARAGIGSHN